MYIPDSLLKIELVGPIYTTEYEHNTLVAHTVSTVWIADRVYATDGPSSILGDKERLPEGLVPFLQEGAEDVGNGVRVARILVPPRVVIHPHRVHILGLCKVCVCCVCGAVGLAWIDDTLV